MDVKINEKYSITTDHPLSSYGTGSLDSDGRVCGPVDLLPTNYKKLFGVDVRVEARHGIMSPIRNPHAESARTPYTRPEKAQIRAWLSQDPAGIFLLPAFGQLKRDRDVAERCINES